MSSYDYKGDCPVAEKTQPKMMQFKANYRSLENAEKNIKILNKVLKQIGECNE